MKLIKKHQKSRYLPTTLCTKVFINLQQSFYQTFLCNSQSKRDNVTESSKWVKCSLEMSSNNNSDQTLTDWFEFFNCLFFIRWFFDWAGVFFFHNHFLHFFYANWRFFFHFLVRCFQWVNGVGDGSVTGYFYFSLLLYTYI